MSASINKTLYVFSKDKAKLNAYVVLPSEGLLDVTKKLEFFLSFA